MPCSITAPANSVVSARARPGIVHRLDKDTSGCLMVAKNDAAHHALSAQFADRKTTKIYQALVCGHAKERLSVKVPIARHPVHRKKMAIVERGRDSHTDFRVLEVLRDSALVEATLHTGRTHQIRVHPQHLGCPLVGDPVYGGRPPGKLPNPPATKPRAKMLHAAALGFTHPLSGKKMEVNAPLPADFADALNFLKTR